MNKTLDTVAFVLVIIGGLNMGLAALGYDVINSVLGPMTTITRLVFILIGLSALYLAIMASKKRA